MRKFLLCVSIFLFFFFLPVGWSKHWLIPQSLAGGVLVDYLMPDLWIQDLLAIALVMAHLLSFHNQLLISGCRKLILPLSLLLAVIAFSRIPLVSLVYFLRFFLMVLTSIVVFSLLKSRRREATVLKKWALVGLTAALFLTGILAIGQLAKQGTVFGWWFFGEPIFGLGSGGVKKLDFFGKMLVAPMATFPHSNIMGAFGLLALIIFLENRKLIVGGDGKANIWLWRMILFFSLILSLLSFSTPVWLLATYLIVNRLFTPTCPQSLAMHGRRVDSYVFHRLIKNSLGKRILLFLLLVTVSILFFLSNPLSPPSVSRRLFLAKVSWRMFLDHPLFGVGWGCFTKVLPEYWRQIRTNIRFLQPVHNLFLLVISEIGLVGASGLVILIKRLFGKINFVKWWLPIAIFLILSFFDHYFWTTTQGIYLLVPLFTLANKNPRPDSN